MDKIENVDLRKALGEIAECNTAFHLENDLGISIEQMERAAKLKDYTDKTLIWVSYPSGIDCYPEREVFQKDTRGYNGVFFHGFDMQSDLKFVYAVDVTGIKDGRVHGSLYETDIRQFAAYVKKNAVSSNTIRIYEDDPHGGGKQTVMPKAEFDRRYPRDLVKMAYWRHEPADPSALKAVMDDMWNSFRDGKHDIRTLWGHTNKLYDNRFNFYASQLIRDLAKVEQANSPDGQNFSVPLHGVIAATFDPDRLSRLLEKLPYENAVFTVRKGQIGMRLVVPSHEVLQERAERQVQPADAKDGKVLPAAIQPYEKREPAKKPSILAALKQGAEKSKQQPATDKVPKKSKGMEI